MRGIQRSAEERSRLYNLITNDIKSGLSVSESCRKHDVPSGTYFSWGAKLNSSPNKKVNKKLPVLIEMATNPIESTSSKAALFVGAPKDLKEIFDSIFGN